MLGNAFTVTVVIPILDQMLYAVQLSARLCCGGGGVAGDGASSKTPGIAGAGSSDCANSSNNPYLCAGNAQYIHLTQT